MDVRVVLLLALVAVVAAIRWRRRAPDEPGGTGSTPDEPDTPPQPGAKPADLGSGSAADRRRTTGRGRDATNDPADDQDHVDVELQAALDRVWNEHAHDADTMLDARLRQLIDRGVPIRALRPAPGGRAIRVVFADGTVLLCRGTGQGDFGRLGLALTTTSVRLGGFARTDSGTRLEFRWHPDHRLAAVAVGLDQPD